MHVCLICCSLSLLLVRSADASQMVPCRTKDEDFGILLEAAVMYDRRVAALLGESDSASFNQTSDTYSYSRKPSPFPRLLIVVTGT